MGCSSSRAEESPMVVLCRDRRDLIRAAADRRYDLASAHASYFRSLSSVGDSLHRFVHDELSLAGPTPPPSPVLTIPSSEGKQSNGSTAAAAPGGSISSSISSATPLSHSISPEGSHLHLSSPSDSEPKISAAQSPNHYYMRSSTAIPSVVYEEPYPAAAATAQWSDPPPPGYDYGYGGYGYPQYSQYAQYGVPIGSPPPPAQNDPYYGDWAQRPTPPPPPPPPPQGSSWDFFNPFFNSYEQDPAGYYAGSYAFGSAVSSPNSSEVREKEGIPDLEEDTELEPPSAVAKGKKAVDAGAHHPGSGSGTSTREKKVKYDPVVREEKKTEEKKIKSGSKEAVGKGSIAKKDIREEKAGKKKKKKGSSFDEDSSLVTEESGPSNVSSLVTEESGPSNVSSLATEDSGPGNVSSLATEESGPSNENSLTASGGTRDIMEAVDEIKERFRLAADFGEEVSNMLEVGKMRYQPSCGVFGVICSRLLDLMAPPTHLSHHSMKRQRPSSASSLKNKASYADNEKLIGMKSGNLSSTLEKLYVWEKRLYKEVKDEERLRIVYDNKCRQLKALDERGAESHKIDATRASIRKLSTKISVAIKSIDTISSRMHKIRDDELQPQLTELIRGLIRMWKFVLDCHQKQLQAITDSKNDKLMAKTAIGKSSVAKVTVELEGELLNWCSCFSDWISHQKAYIEALNGWLMKWLPQEQEMTPDGIAPFSPSNFGAPAAFIISNDWYRAIERVSEVEVINAIHSFAASVHKLWESQNEEYRQRLKAEYLSRDFATRLKSMQNESGLNIHLDVMQTTEDSQTNNDVNKIALDSMKNRLNEEREKHEKIVKQVQEAASGSLRTGLVLVFESLGNFTLETVKAYEVLRLPNEGAGG